MKRPQFAIGLAAADPAVATSPLLAANRTPARGGKIDAIVLGAGVAGLNAAWLLEQKGKREGRARILAKREELRPAAKRKLTAHRSFSWYQEYFNAGDRAYFAPGQIADFVRTTAQPAGRIHVCSEHTATRASGLEGALESAKRAVIEVLSL